MRLAIKYNTYYVDTTRMTKQEVFECLKTIIEVELKGSTALNYKLPNPDTFTPEMFSKLPLVAEGYSKIVRAVDDRFTLIEYKPTVYSHKQRREDVIPFTDKERMSMTRQ